jgi:hypothetical protein
LDLLELDANLIRKLLLRHSNHPTTMADPFPNMGVYWMFHSTLRAVLSVTLIISKKRAKIATAGIMSKKISRTAEN